LLRADVLFIEIAARRRERATGAATEAYCSRLAWHCAIGVAGRDHYASTGELELRE
jgi:hypothetical protein